MVTLQDISIQLMKPAKDLADWKFPLSQILEEYYALLEEPCNVNFGEAALVLQNSTNVYVRRVERLCSETKILRQTFFGYNTGEEIKQSAYKEKKTSKNSYVDFENFVIIDLECDIGKNINKKNRFQIQKKVKLLSHRFTQLESNTTQLCIPFQVYDVLGEVIGKKYDFRCNQAINMNGLLVDELTPYDFTHVPGSRVNKSRNSLSLYSEPKTSVTGTSGYHSVASPNDNESMTPNHMEFEEEHNFSLPMDSVSLVDESEIREEENAINKQYEILPANANNSDRAITENNSPKEQCNQEILVQDLTNVNQCSSIQDFNDCEIKKKRQSTNSKEMNPIENEYKSYDKNREVCKANDRIASSFKKLGLVSKQDQHEIVQMNELDNVQYKEGLLGMRKRGNQATKMSICTVDDINERDWKPMPLIQGIKTIWSNNSSVLKLPEYISLLETKYNSKKRKFASRIQKSECLTKFVLRETESSTKDSFLSQTKQRFKRLRKHELDDFIKNLDECLNNTERETDNPRYEPVTDDAVDLLGFRISQNEHNLFENEAKKRSSTFSPADMKSKSTSRHNSLDSEESSSICNDWPEPPLSEIDMTYSLPDYQTLIEDKMKKIFEESNVATELEQSVEQWHVSLQPKLSEAEIRPTFRIHDYTSRIIGTLQSLDKKKVNFDRVVQDKPACEVARYFLASLQLANTYNVEIMAENSDSSIQIALLDDGKRLRK